MSETAENKDPGELLAVNGLLRDELERDFERVVLDPFRDPSRACALLVPAGWTQVHVDVPPEFLASDDAQTISLGGFHPEDDESISLQLQYVRLAGELVEDPELEVASIYLQLFTEAAGLEPLVARPVELEGGPALQALAKSGEEESATYTWILARRVGAILFLVVATCPVRRFPTFRERLAACLRSLVAGER